MEDKAVIFRRYITQFALALALAAVACLQAFEIHAAERQFYSGYVGTLPADRNDLAGTYSQRPEVLSLLKLLETAATETPGERRSGRAHRPFRIR